MNLLVLRSDLMRQALSAHPLSDQQCALAVMWREGLGPAGEAAGLNALAAPSVKPRESGEKTSRISTEANKIFTASASQRAAWENNASLPWCGSVPATSDWFYKERDLTKENLDSILEITIMPFFD